MISINGSVISSVISTGQNVVITNGRVIVDGKDVTPEAKEISIKIEGNLNTLKVDACSSIEVTGSVGQVQTQSGDVTVGGNINGSVSTMSGSVMCDGSIDGSVSTMSGSIRSRK